MKATVKTAAISSSVKSVPRYRKSMELGGQRADSFNI